MTYVETISEITVVFEYFSLEIKLRKSDSKKYIDEFARLITFYHVQLKCTTEDSFQNMMIQTKKKKKKFKTETEQLKTEKVKLVTESLEKVILEQF